MKGGVARAAAAAEDGDSGHHPAARVRAASGEAGAPESSSFMELYEKCRICEHFYYNFVI